MFDIKKICMIYDMEKEEKMYALKGFDLKSTTWKKKKRCMP